MKKLLLISLVLIGCTKADYCVLCEKESNPPHRLCKEGTPNITAVTYQLTNQGYTCVRD